MSPGSRSSRTTPKVPWRASAEIDGCVAAPTLACPDTVGETRSSVPVSRFAEGTGLRTSLERLREEAELTPDAREVALQLLLRAGLRAGG